jgi:uncharacterized membrane protein YdfJ with MMPL/SSD domain
MDRPFALWSARHRWPVFSLWFVLTVGVFVASVALGGIRAVAATGGLGGSDTEASQGTWAINAGRSTTASETLAVVVTSPTS